MKKCDCWSRYFEVKGSSWPMAVHSLGFNRIPPNAGNVMLQHPYHHWMDEKQWRVLETLTMVHVVRGWWNFKSKESGNMEVPPGSLIFVFPKVRHWYHCRKGAGGDDEWVEIEASDGLLSALGQAGVSPASPVVQIGDSPLMLRQFRRLFDLGRNGAGQVILAARAYETVAMAFDELAADGRPRAAVKKMQMALGGGASAGVGSVASAVAATQRSASWMRTVFRRATGLSPKRYQLTQRLARAAEMLQSTDRPVTEIALQSGFCSLSAFSNSFAREYGCAPSVFRNRR